MQPIFAPNPPIRSHAWTTRCRSCWFRAWFRSPRIFAPVMPALWRFGPVTVANHIRDDNMGAIARRILAEAPPRFALAGHSMGGYIAFEIMRQAPDRVAKLALINTQARPDTPEATARRRGHDGPRRERANIAPCSTSCFPGFVHPSRPRRCRLAPARPRHGRRCRGGGICPPADGDHRPAGLAADAGLDQMPDAGADGRRGQHHPECAVEGDGRAAFTARNS